MAAGRAALDRAAADDRERDAALRAERADLEAARDPKPAEPPWLDAGRAGEPLWRCVDFAAQLDDGQRAGLEGALLAAGLLSAVITPNGSVLAADGELLISPGATLAGQSLASVLQADPAASLPAATITAVLRRGRFRRPGRGRLGVRRRALAERAAAGPSRRCRARHIGAAARTAHRQERISEIDGELARLAEQALLRDRQRGALDETEAALDRLVGAAPRTADLFAARRVAAESTARGGRSAARAAREAGRARQARTTWASELAAHQATCAHQGLPAGPELLEAVAEAAGRARDNGTQLGQELARLDGYARRHSEQRQRVATAGELRHRAERVADETWSRWHSAASALAAQHDAIDLSVGQAQAELAQAQQAHLRADRDLGRATTAVNELGPQLGAAREASKQAAEHADQQLSRMAVVGQRFNRSIALPGLAAAAAAERLDHIVQPDQLDQVTAAAKAVLATVAAVRRRRSTARSRLSRTLTGRCPASWTCAAGSMTRCYWSKSPGRATNGLWPGRPGSWRNGSAAAGRR